jgi:hypothetical protein
MFVAMFHTTIVIVSMYALMCLQSQGMQLRGRVYSHSVKKLNWPSMLLHAHVDQEEMYDKADFKLQSPSV